MIGLYAVRMRLVFISSVIATNALRMISAVTGSTRVIGIGGSSERLRAICSRASRRRRPPPLRRPPGDDPQIDTAEMGIRDRMIGEQDVAAFAQPLEIGVQFGRGSVQRLSKLGHEERARAAPREDFENLVGAHKPSTRSALPWKICSITSSV